MGVVYTNIYTFSKHIKKREVKLSLRLN